MKIISRYVVREHVGPFAFALTALTSLMLLNYIAKNFAQLVGKGLPERVILEFFALAIPFTVAMTLPMAVLVAVLYAFQRLAAENEITAFKASGVSMQRLTLPALVLGGLFSLVMLGFNDQILPRANHRLATLQSDIFRASPTFALKEQVINPIKEGQLYLKAGRITRGSAHMKEVVVYDLTDPVRRRTIYADSGILALARNGQDLYMTLYHGVMRELPTDKPDEVTQLYYEQDFIRVRGVATQFQESASPREIKSDREMSICEMQTRLDELDSRYQLTVWEYRRTVAEAERGDGRKARDPEKFVVRRKTGLGRSYCTLQQVAIDLVRPAVAKAQAPAQGQSPQRRDTAQARQDSAKASQDTLKARRDSVRQDSLRRAAADSAARAARAAAGTSTGATTGAVSGATSGATSGAVVVPAPANPVVQPGVVPGAVPPGVAPGVFPPVVPPGVVPPTGATAAATATPNYTSPTVTGRVPQSRWSRVNDARDAVNIAREARNRFAVEIQKKFSLAAACFIFVLIGAPVALRFPRGGVGMVIGVSLGIFAVSYVGLIGGEALADKGLMSPFWAMWTANIILFVIGVVLTARMGRETSGTRGGGPGEWWQARRARRAMRRAAARPVPA